MPVISDSKYFTCVFFLSIFCVHGNCMSAGMSCRDSVITDKNMQYNLTSENFETGGTVIDETITKLGRDFFEIFYGNWEAPVITDNIHISVMEKPQPRLGTLITIKINDLEVYQSFLQPKYDIIEEFALDAVQQCLIYVQNYDAIISELQGDDLKGSGIF